MTIVEWPVVLHVSLRRIDSEIPLPAYARDGDAGLDLASAVDVVLAAAGGRALVGTGVAVAIPAGYAGLIVPRSGLAHRHGISVVNAPGLIDSGYRGELMVALINTDPHEAFTVRRGDRIAQLVIVAVPSVSLVVVDELPTSNRAEGGFGHTGR